MTDTETIDFSKFHLPWASERPSIYEFLNARFNSELPIDPQKDFSLPDYQTAYEREPADNQVQLILSSLDDFNIVACDETLNATYDLLVPTVYEKQFIEFVEQFRQNKHFHKGNVPQLARWLVFNAPDREVLILCSAILFICNEKPDQELIYNLARSTIFQTILYKLFQTCENPIEDDMWRMAKVYNSYARIYLAPLLSKTKNPSIQHWFLRDATKHDLLVEFAYFCAVGGDLISEISKETIDKELLQGVTRILIDMLHGPGGKNIHDYPDGPDAIRHLIRHLESKPPELSDVCTFGSIKRFIEKVTSLDDEKARWLSVRKPILNKCLKVIEDPKWIPQIRRDFNSTDQDASWAAEAAAFYVNIDLWNEYFERMEKNTISVHDWSFLLIDDSSERMSKLTKAAQHLDLESITKIRILRRLTKFPGIGSEFVLKMLEEQNQQALEVLEAWGPEHLNEQLIESLMKFAEEEKDGYFQTSSIALLNRAGLSDVWDKYFALTKSGGTHWDILAIGLTQERALKVCELAENRLPEFDPKLKYLIESLANFPGIGCKLVEAGIKSGDPAAKKSLATLKKWGPDHWDADLMASALRQYKNP